MKDKNVSGKNRLYQKIADIFLNLRSDSFIEIDST